MFEYGARARDFGTDHISANASINAHAYVSCRARGLNFSLDFHVHVYFVITCSEGSGESALCADAPEPSLLTDAISTLISCTGPCICRFRSET